MGIFSRIFLGCVDMANDHEEMIKTFNDNYEAFFGHSKPVKKLDLNQQALDDWQERFEKENNCG